jgi:hypothetical protein
MKTLFELTMSDMLTILERVYEKSGPCTCDTAPPWHVCNGCLAAGALNDASGTFRNAIRELRARGEELSQDVKN